MSVPLSALLSLLALLLPTALSAQVIELGRPAPPLPEVVVEDPAGVEEPAADADLAEPAADADMAEPSIKIEQLWLESGVLTQDQSQAQTSNYLHTDLAAEWAFAPRWSVRLGARLDGYLQTGVENFDSLELDVGESYLRYQDLSRRITLGPQIVTWGRVDETPPTDQLSVQDVSRGLLDDLEDRRRAVLSARWEEFIGDFKVDLLYVPRFRAAEMPRLDNIWSPVNQRRGEIIGMPFNPLTAPLIQNGRFDENEGGSGGWGVRVSRPGRGLDFALTLQQTRPSLPYYVLDSRVRDALLARPWDIASALNAAPETFVARYPRTWVAGGDLGLTTETATWRLEAAWRSDQPATTGDLRMITREAIDWVAGVEFYPGDRELRVNLQLGGGQVLNAPARMLDRQKTLSLFGDLENGFARDRWRARLRYFVGLDANDVYLNPQIAFVGHEPHELYLAYHYFDGTEQTLGGFYQHNDLVTLGWRMRF